MKIHFHGAAGDVTNAAFPLTTERASMLVDRGLYQGRREIVAKKRVVPKPTRGWSVSNVKGPDRSRAAGGAGALDAPQPPGTSLVASASPVRTRAATRELSGSRREPSSTSPRGQTATSP